MNKYAPTVFQTLLYTAGTKGRNARRVVPSKPVNGDQVNNGGEEWIPCWIPYRYTAIKRDGVRNVGTPLTIISMFVLNIENK